MASLEDFMRLMAGYMLFGAASQVVIIILLLIIAIAI
jgi:hypothetical protein